MNNSFLIKIVFLITFFFSTGNLFASDVTNSDFLLKEIDSILNNSPDSLRIKSVIEKLRYFEQKDDRISIIISINRLNDYYSKIEKSRKDVLSLLKIKRILGLSYNYLGLYSESINISTELLLQAKKYKDTALIINTLYVLAHSYSDLGEDKKGLVYDKEALKLALETKNNFRIDHSLVNISADFLGLQQPDSALYYLNKCTLEHATKAMRFVYYLNRGESYLQKNQFQRSLELLNKSKEILEDYESFYFLASLESLYGSVYFETNRKKEAINRALRSLEISKKHQFNTIQLDVLKLLAKIYRKDDISKSEFYHEKYTVLQDSLNLNNLNNAIKNVKLIYSVERKNKEIELLEIENKLKNTKFKSLVIFFGIFFVFGLYIFYQRNKKLQIYKKLVEENIKSLESHEKIVELRNKISFKNNNNLVNLEVKKVSNSSLLSNEQIENIELLIIEAFNKDEIFLDKDISLNNFAKMINTNTQYLSFVLNNVFKSSFKELLNEYRINKAKKLLLEKSDKFTIEFIALSSGFSNSVTFNRNFKKLTGITPSLFISLSKEQQN